MRNHLKPGEVAYEPFEGRAAMGGGRAAGCLVFGIEIERVRPPSPSSVSPAWPDSEVSRCLSTSVRTWQAFRVEPGVAARCHKLCAAIPRAADRAR